MGRRDVKRIRGRRLWLVMPRECGGSRAFTAKGENATASHIQPHPATASHCRHSHSHTGGGDSGTGASDGVWPSDV